LALFHGLYPPPADIRVDEWMILSAQSDWTWIDFDSAEIAGKVWEWFGLQFFPAELSSVMQIVGGAKRW